ncbi:MAG: GNAT family N-acetyltransferase [Pseudonocardiaceae bacterium]|nr:GNAT family N-acetyltransferase [Pseudonocardiaceae bacterium]
MAIPSGASAGTVTWRLRVELDDRPGALARIANRLAHYECNVLAVSVLPVPGGVVDEIVIKATPGTSADELRTAIHAEGAECQGLTRADVHELVDAPTEALRTATLAIGDRQSAAEALQRVLAADAVTLVPADEANPARTENGHRTVLPVGDAQAFVIRRHWAPFVQVELTRAAAFAELLTTVENNTSRPGAVICTDGSAIVLRTGEPKDADAVAAMHARCSMETLFTRYHNGRSSVPRRWLHRLLCPPRGCTVLAFCGRDVIALGQLITATQPGPAEISLLVEDEWQRRGVGTALLGRLAATARADGHQELYATCLPEQHGVFRTAMRAGLAPTARVKDGELRVSMTTAPPGWPNRSALSRLAVAPHS